MPIPPAKIAHKSHQAFLRRLMRIQRRSRRHASQAGFTLLEALVALIIVSIIMVFITPPIFMATASRIQDRRAEQALQLAQAEIDRVRATVERGTYTDDDIPDQVTQRLEAVPAPTTISRQLKSSVSRCNTYDGSKIPSNTLLQVDVTGDCESDFLVQSFRSDGPDSGSTTPYTTGFRMATRVYVDLSSLRNNLGGLQSPPKPASLSFTTGLGGQSKQPLSILYSTVVRNDTSNSLQDYRTVCPSTGGC
jgi:prepilin-type N-terminal cleavage/methylation domain-containing protein